MSDFSNLFSNFNSSQRRSQFFIETQLENTNAFHPNLLSPIRFNQNDSYQSHSNNPILDIQQIQAFNDSYNYAVNLLKSWGLILGSLNYSIQNNKTIICLMQLIRLRQKDVDYRAKVQQDIAKIQFETTTTKSTLNRTNIELQNCKKMLGSLQNKCKSDQIKFKRQIQKLNSQKNDLVQIKQKLQQKNNQSIHQIKKRDVQIARIKETLKKPVQKGPIKNGIDIISVLPIKYQKNQEYAQFNLLKQKYQQQRKNYIKQNKEFRDQYQQFTEILNDFIIWSKQTFPNRINIDKKVTINHNLPFKKQTLSQELAQIIKSLKNFLTSDPSTLDKQKEKVKQNKQNTIKKKNSINQINVPSLNVSPPPSFKKQQSVTSRDYINEQKNNVLNLRKIVTTKQIQSTKMGQKNLKNKFNEDISIISHISIKDVASPKLKNQFNKWDILWDE